MTLVYDTITIHGSPAPRNVRSWNPAAYEEAVASVLRRLHKTRLGSLVLANLRGLVGIRPSADFADQHADSRERDPYDAHAAGEPLRWARDLPDTPWDDTGEIADGHFGEGHGTVETIVRFTPGQWPRRRPGAPLRCGLAPFTDEHVLFHELVHSVDALHGAARQSHAWFGFSNIDEYRAVAVSNMYLSELGYPLRANFDDHAAYEGETRAPRREGYRVPSADQGVRIDPVRVQFEREMIDLYFRDAPVFTHQLEHVPRHVCPYNPFRAFRAGRFEEIPLADPWTDGACGRR